MEGAGLPDVITFHLTTTDSR
jgi:protein-S-isoprenylcysteine O-methyltransferase Ste14